MMRSSAQADRALAAVRAAARPLAGDEHDHDDLLDLIGDAPLVLLGEASHGTHEFYRTRACITRRLIVEKQFAAVAVEGDWPDAYRVNRFVRGQGADADADAALAGFQRFPTWMWRNTVVAAFVDWLRGHNARLPAAEHCGFYGLDLYSLHGSIAAVLAHLDRTDPGAAQRARQRYGCFDSFGPDAQVYGLMAGLGRADDCEDEVVSMLVELAGRARTTGSAASAEEAEAAFDAEQNARLVTNAEAYYRQMFRRGVSTWNLRDDHMADTVAALRRHLARPGAGGGSAGREPKIVIWAHNSHLGDARATEMGQRGEINLGQRLREAHGERAVLVGFSTHGGTVMAANDWDEPGERQRVNPAREDSIEGLLHAAGRTRFLLPLRGDPALAQALAEPLLQRAIGVIYRPQTERQSHYFHSRVARQFDALIHLDETRAVDPLPAPAARGAGEGDGEPPETYPSGL
jgi:erythromycin esterase-like protein